MEIAPYARELLLEETQMLIDRIPDPERQKPYVELVTGIETGHLPEPSLEALQMVLELGLRTGRVRKVHGPQAESTFIGLYQKTPRGSQAAQSTEEVSHALEALRGQTIEDLRFSLRGPGAYILTIDTELCHLTVEVGDEGVWVKDLGVEV